MSAPSTLQTKFVRDLQKQIHLPNQLLNNHCVSRFGSPFAGLDRRQCSELIDEMKSWKAVPRELQIAMGQTEMFR